MSPIILLACFSVLTFPFTTFAQEKSAATAPPTLLEGFLAKTGSIVVKDFHSLGEIPKVFGEMSLETLILYEPGKEPQRVRGLRVQVEGPPPGQRSGIAFLDMDEVEALSRGLDYMIKLASFWAGKPREYTEVIYHTMGDLEVGFYVKDNRLKGFAKAGRIGAVTAYLEVDSMRTFKEKVDEGFAYLKGH